MSRDGRPLPVKHRWGVRKQDMTFESKWQSKSPSFPSIALVMGRGWTLWRWWCLLLGHEIETRRKWPVTFRVLSVSLCCILKSRQQNNAELVWKIPFANVFLRITCLKPVSDFLPGDGIKGLQPLLPLLALLFGKSHTRRCRSSNQLFVIFTQIAHPTSVTAPPASWF